MNFDRIFFINFDRIIMLGIFSNRKTDPDRIQIVFHSSREILDDKKVRIPIRTYLSLCKKELRQISKYLFVCLFFTPIFLLALQYFGFEHVRNNNDVLEDVKIILDDLYLYSFTTGLIVLNIACFAFALYKITRLPARLRYKIIHKESSLKNQNVIYSGRKFKVQTIFNSAILDKKHTAKKVYMYELVRT